MKTQGYPMYHSLHDTVYWMEHFVDKEYKCHLTVGRVAMYYLLYMADLTLVPYDAKYYGEHLKRGAENLTTQLKSKGGDAAGVSTGNCFVWGFFYEFCDEKILKYIVVDLKLQIGRKF